MPRFYYYVEPCPRCKSRKTGRYVKQPLTGGGYMMEESLKAGELIRFLPFEPVKNGYCVTCGYEWHTRAKLKFWSNEKVRDEQTARGTEMEYARFLQANNKSEYQGEQSYEKEKDADMTLIDSRPKPVVEILYIDEELISQL